VAIAGRPFVFGHEFRKLVPKAFETGDLTFLELAAADMRHDVADRERVALSAADVPNIDALEIEPDIDRDAVRAAFSLVAFEVDWTAV
tara:strand:+ start:95 stop:358 length:264 start_codon:yes stop_codon:yes gene_type:complete